MFWAYLKFCFTLFNQAVVAHYYREEFIADSQHPHYRRFSKRYKKKQSLVKNCWIGAGLITLLFPVLHVAFITTLLTTLLSFCILDETD